MVPGAGKRAGKTVFWSSNVACPARDSPCGGGRSSACPQKSQRLDRGSDCSRDGRVIRIGITTKDEIKALGVSMGVSLSLIARNSGRSCLLIGVYTKRFDSCDRGSMAQQIFYCASVCNVITLPYRISIWHFLSICVRARRPMT